MLTPAARPSRRPGTARWPALAPAILAALAALIPATGQGQQLPPPEDPPPEATLPADPGAPAQADPDAATPDGPDASPDPLKRREQVEREMRKIRARFFRGVRHQETRQLGFRKLREFTEPRFFPAMLEIFGGEDEDVRAALLDHLADLKMDEADATLAWAAVFGEDESFRAAALERLRRRVHEVGEASWRVKIVLAQGLKRRDETPVAAAAQAIQALKLYEAIPMLINAQAEIGGGGEDVRTGALAWILVGQQQAYVADLQPVVGENAVAFDPELAVVTSGVVMRVIDAVVVTYRFEVHRALVAMTTDAWGRPTAEFGFDNRRWWRWYEDEFKPFLEARERASAEGGEPGEPAPGATDDGEPDPGRGPG